jgi:hypothetical protein
VNKLDSGEYECLLASTDERATMKLTVYGRVDDLNVLDKKKEIPIATEYKQKILTSF